MDPNGDLWFSAGHGYMRERLARLGITRELWDSLPRGQRTQVKIAVQAIIFAEDAISVMVKHHFAGTAASAERFLLKLVKLKSAENKAAHGFKAEKHRFVAFRRAKGLRSRLVPLLAAVKDEGSALHRKTFTDEKWCVAKARSLNAALTGPRGREETLEKDGNLRFASRPVTCCSPKDIAQLGSDEPEMVATRIASRVFKISQDSLRYDELRFRSKKSPPPEDP